MSDAATARALAGSWLGHLRRDRRGLPIPWVNRWGGETIAATRVAYDAHVGRIAVFHDDHGDIPDYTRQNMGRQRQAVMGGLCQVCGRPCPWSRRNLVVSSVSVNQVSIDNAGGRRAVAVHEPWLDDRCAQIATGLCPALIRRAHDDDMHIVAVRSRREVDVIVSVGYLDPVGLDDDGRDPYGAERLAAHHRTPVAMWAKIVLLNQPVTMRDPRPATG